MSAAEKIVTSIAQVEIIEADPFSRIPHLFLDTHGRLASCFAPAQVLTATSKEVRNNNGDLLGSAQVKDEHFAEFQALFARMEQNLLPLHLRNQATAMAVLERDIESLLGYATSANFSFDLLLERACLYLRSHLLAENCSIFGLPDGHTFTGLFALTPHGVKRRTDEWASPAMNVASMVIAQKIPYISRDVSVDANYAPGATAPPRNLVCFPLVNKGEAIGIVNVGNKLSGPFTDSDLLIVQRFAVMLSHVLQQEFDKTKGEKAENVAQNLGKYLSKNVVRKIDAAGTSGDLGGIMKKVVVLFSDIRSFTSISEGLSPPDLVSLLNLYFEEMGQVVERYNGTIDKLVGDLMMVLWNIPADQPDPEVLALKCAIDMQKTFKKKVLPKWMEKGVPHFGIGIGINSGAAVVGNLGSSHFMNYTVIGPSINLAQRLEAKAKAGEVWIHESILRLVEGKVPKPVRKESGIKLKGVAEPVTAYVFMDTQF